MITKLYILINWKFASFDPHTSSSIPPHKESHPVELWVRPSVVFKHTLPPTIRCVPHTSKQSDTRSYDRTHYFPSYCAHCFNTLFFFYSFRINRSLCCTALSPWTSLQSGVGICRQPKVGIILRKFFIQTSSPGI